MVIAERYERRDHSIRQRLEEMISDPALRLRVRAAFEDADQIWPSTIQRILDDGDRRPQGQSKSTAMRVAYRRARAEHESQATAVSQLLVDAQAAWAERKTATFDHAMTEPFSAYALASIDRTLAGVLADLKRAETLGHREDADFAQDTVEMLTANRDAIRAARVARGWSEDGDQAPEA